ncbi:hypothetical protein [Spiroplasma sp. AdecLV25b]|uniref:hypothetical protein n=1 Tax=Spiroplasma sp. AdecLV25b TaxID=3027162 RepID=UPI0027DECE51|nr:hypothetical protein [Spiroplasma sp. AdecLV25b]
MEIISNKKISETTLLVSKPQQSELIKSLKFWTLGVGSIAVAVVTAFPVAIINNWKTTGTLSFENGIDDLMQNPPLLIVPEISTTLLTTGAYIAIENLIVDFVNKNISKTNKGKSAIKNLILSLALITTNEIVKKINVKLTTSVPINTDIFDGLFVIVALNFSKEAVVVIIWKKYIEGFDFYSIGIPILSTVGYFLFNSLQTFYKLGKNNLSLEKFIKIFLPILLKILLMVVLE